MLKMKSTKLYPTFIESLKIYAKRKYLKNNIKGYALYKQNITILGCIQCNKENIAYASNRSDMIEGNYDLTVIS